MLIAYFIVAGLLALANLAAGGGKLLQPKQRLYEQGMRYTEDFAGWQIKLIGLAEVLGAVGLVLPLALDAAGALPGWIGLLSPIAAICLGVLQLAALVVHVRRKEPFVPNLVFIVFSIAAAVLGFLVA